jgi:Glycosyl transferase family 11
VNPPIERCVVTRIHGGLGNQLFEYAAGHALAHRLGVSHKVDTHLFQVQFDRTLGLREFNLPLHEATPAELRHLTPQWGPWWKNKAILWSHKLTPFNRRRWVLEETFDFDARLFHAQPPCYLDGWWQSEKYFADCAGQIRRMFRLSTPPSPRVAALGAEITHARAIAVHVRRGDYVHNRDAALFHGCCSPEYYAAAGRWMRERLPQAPFYVFSDDPAWARAHLTFSGPVSWIEAAPPHSAHEDFFLLGCCDHFIIANSSFSWWPAWLQDAPTKRVVAPGRWFLGHNVNVPDRFPSGWHLIDA